MAITFDLEVKLTIIERKGLDVYTKWLEEDKDKCMTVGLTVSYNMGWNKFPPVVFIAISQVTLSLLVHLHAELLLA